MANYAHHTREDSESNDSTGWVVGSSVMMNRGPHTRSESTSCNSNIHYNFLPITYMHTHVGYKRSINLV